MASVICTQDLDSYYTTIDGKPNSNGIVTFYQNGTTILKPVYQQVGSVPPFTYTALPNPVILNNAGNAQNASGDNIAVFYWPYDGTPSSSEGNLQLYDVFVADQFTNPICSRLGWPPQALPGGGSEAFVGSEENQISNPTFTNVFLDDGYATTYTTSGPEQTFVVAPDWNLTMAGSGTVILQRFPISGVTEYPTTPPYVLDVNVSSGISLCYLTQTLSTNSGLWGLTPGASVYLSGSFVAANQAVGTAALTMYYQESSANPAVQIVTGSFSSTPMRITGSTADPIPVSLSSGTGKNGYVNIYLSFATASHVQVTSLQLIPSATAAISPLPFDFNSSNRNESFQGDYYIPRCAAKQIPSFLVGWDFPVNPFQFFATGTITTTAQYICDQTIAQSATSNVAWSRDMASDGLSLVGSGTNDAFYLLQYLSADQVFDMIGNNLSVNVFGYQFDTLPSNSITMRVYLFQGNSSSTIPLLSGGTIGTIAANGVFTLTAANWSAVSRQGLNNGSVSPNFPTATAILNNVNIDPNINDGNSDYGFSGWTIPQSVSVDNFAIVVTFAYKTTDTDLILNSISVVPGDLPCRPAIKSADEVLRQCQYYWEKSYDTGTAPGTVISNGSLSRWASVIPFQNGNIPRAIKASVFSFEFFSHKRVNPTIVLYSPLTGSSGVISCQIWGSDGLHGGTSDQSSSGFFTSIISTKSALYQPNNTTTNMTVTTMDTSLGIQGIFNFHYVSDARLGIV